MRVNRNSKVVVQDDMMDLAPEKSEAEIALEQQRIESEARDIIHDVEHLNTIPDEKKSRWIWELMQNANDVATDEGVNITCFLSESELTFSHDGKPFETNNLTAILYKTSTKSLTNDDGSTGKYGTGFVTTHILNKKLTISGVHCNDSGKRRFILNLDRSPIDLGEMKKLLQVTFDEINEFTKTPAIEIGSNLNSFSYLVSGNSINYAKNGIIELESNLAFTLLVNKKIKSVVLDKDGQCLKYTSVITKTELENVQFIQLKREGENLIESGLLFCHINQLIFGIPATKSGEEYVLKPIENQAILFKEFPLIGTEGFNLPVFIQHTQFLPTEQRDGIRTKIVSTDEKDIVAEQNRAALIDFITAYQTFIDVLVKAKVKDLHLLAKSGLPEKVVDFSNIDWFQESIQDKIRKVILKHDIVRTKSGELIKISEAKFTLLEGDTGKQFYSLVSRLLPNKCPDESSHEQWAEIILQEKDDWPQNIELRVEDLLKLINEKLDLKEESSFQWLKDLYAFLYQTEFSSLADNYPIYPNENSTFCYRNKVAIHPEIDSAFKVISKGLGRDLNDEFLHRSIQDINSKHVQSFDLIEYYKLLNTDIGNLEVSTASEENIQAIFKICCLFKTDQSKKRNAWFEIIHKLLPELTPEKQKVSINYDYSWKSAEHWSMKFIAYNIEKHKPTSFSEEYFQQDDNQSFDWLNKFISYAFETKEDTRDIILKYNIIPTQSDEFKVYGDEVFREDDTRYFNETIKHLYNNFTEKGDPRVFLVDNRITYQGIRTKDVKELTGEIDKVFSDKDISHRVKKNGDLNTDFLQLYAWYEDFGNPSFLLPIFDPQCATLYIQALGDGFSKSIIEINKLGKSIDELKELAEIKLSAAQMKQLEEAAAKVGREKLLEKAKEMIAEADAIRWRQEVGTSAETSFVSAIEGLESIFDIENPDRGMDFVLSFGDSGKKFYIEIKSTIIGKETVKMSRLQGITAVENKENYALCVINRPGGEIVLEDYFKKEALFVIDIGKKIGTSIVDWDSGIKNLKKDSDVSIQLEKEETAVYINRNVWHEGMPFTDFIEHIKTHFGITA